MPTLLKVAILMGSRSDLDTMKAATKELDEFGVPYEMKALSAHRSPDAVKEFVESATLRGARVFIAGAGVAAHLAGAVAAQTAYPVIGVPIGSSKLGGMDSLLSTVQMPPGVLDSLMKKREWQETLSQTPIFSVWWSNGRTGAEEPRVWVRVPVTRKAGIEISMAVEDHLS